MKSLFAEMLPAMRGSECRSHLTFEVFKLANAYLFGKPVRAVAGEELAPPIRIDISAIPCRPRCATPSFTQSGCSFVEGLVSQEELVGWVAHTRPLRDRCPRADRPQPTSPILRGGNTKPQWPNSSTKTGY